MSLCLKAGRLDWRQAISEISSDELSEWVAFRGVEPFGDEWRPIARLCALVANMLGNKCTEDDFLPLAREHIEVVNSKGEFVEAFRKIRDRQWR